jgi:hypothetical protein
LVSGWDTYANATLFDRQELAWKEIASFTDNIAHSDYGGTSAMSDDKIVVGQPDVLNWVHRSMVYVYSF